MYICEKELSYKHEIDGAYTGSMYLLMVALLG